MTDDRERSLVSVAFPAGDPARDGVALVTLDRREARNALSFALLADLDEVLAVLDDDESCRAIVITGAGERAFAAGADIRDLASSTREQLRRDDPFAAVDRVGRLRTPVIAAVRGYALGGGCELAMACDIVVAGDDAVFGQPELSIGVIPGAGGTQRLARAVGRARAMDLVLSGARCAPTRRSGSESCRSSCRRRGARDGARPSHRDRGTPGRGGAGGEGRGQRGAAAAAGRGAAVRARAVRGAVRHARPGGGDGRLPREAAAGLAAPLAAPSLSSGGGFLGHRGPDDDDVRLAVRAVEGERAGGDARREPDRLALGRREQMGAEPELVVRRRLDERLGRGVRPWPCRRGGARRGFGRGRGRRPRRVPRSRRRSGSRRAARRARRAPSGPRRRDRAAAPCRARQPRSACRRRRPGAR